MRSWYFFCSMLIGAAPLLIAGATVAAVAAHTARWHLAARLRSAAIIVFAILWPACDCCLNGAAAALRNTSRSAAAFVLTWGSCCNPLALVNTCLVLGWRMTIYRTLLGLGVWALTAAAWSRLAKPAAGPLCDRERAPASFVRNVGGALSSFSVAAALSALVISHLPHNMHVKSPVLAAAAGAILSPCSSADAMLARVLFSTPAAQMAFVVAAQCADVRQLALITRWLGARYAWSAVAAAVLVLTLGVRVLFR